jgi:hypothetical protein
MFVYAHAPTKITGRLALFTASAAIGAAVLAAPSVAFAQRSGVSTPMGNRGTLAIDQLSGFRASSIGGITYAGPIGFSFQSYGQTDLGNNPGSQTTHYTNFWIAPSADFFVIDHLSVGGLVEVSTTSSSIDVKPTANGATTTFTLPSTTNVTLIPRVGWLFPITERFGIWPRGGIGYASRQTLTRPDTNGQRDSYSSAVIDIDCGFLFRVNDSWFFRAAPEVTFGLGGTHSIGNNNATTSADASLFQFAGVAGIGVMWDL